MSSGVIDRNYDIDNLGDERVFGGGDNLNNGLTPDAPIAPGHDPLPNHNLDMSETMESRIERTLNFVDAINGYIWYLYG